MGGGGRQKECVQVEAELEKAGGFGVYQWLTVTIIIAGMLSGGFVIHGIAYLELEPNMYICEGQPCTPEEFCLQPDPQYVYESIDYTYLNETSGEPNTNIYNWYTSLGLVCNENRRAAMSLIASSALIGISLSCLFIPRMGDLYGRKPLYVFALALQIPVYLMAALFTKMIPIYVVAFFLGPCVTGRMACGFLLLLEMVPKKNQAWVGASLMVAEGSCQIIWTVYFVFINRNAFYFIYFTVGLNVAALLGCIYICESPRYLFGMERFEECRKAMVYIAKRNGVKDYEEPTFEEESVMMIEEAGGDVMDRINPSGPLRPTEREATQFQHLAPGDDGRQTRYMTAARQTQTLTKRESVAVMHERVTGLRQTSNIYLAGVDRTQSIALDEIFGKKITDTDGRERTTKTFRKTRVTQSQGGTEKGDTEKKVSEVKTSTEVEMAMITKDNEDEDELVVVPVSVTRGQGLCQGEIALNLCLMIVMWVCTSVNYMIINIFLKYVPGSEYLNFTIAGFSEIFAHLLVGLLFKKCGPKWSFVIGYTVAVAGGACMIFQNKFADNNFLIAAFVLLAKFGASMTLCVCQIATPWIFPTTLCGTAFGICNLFGRFAQAGAPIIAELRIPLPMEVFTASALIALVSSFFIKQAQE